jgi:PmbA protein
MMRNYTMPTHIAASALETLAQETVARALRAGATDAEVVYREGDEFSVNVRLGQVEQLKEAGSRALGIRVFCGHRTASTSTSDLSAEGIEHMVSGAIALAQVTSEDPFVGLPDAAAFGQLDAETHNLGLYHEDVYSLPPADRIVLARRAEEVAMAADTRLVNSDGGSFDASTGLRVLANSRGFVGTSRRSYCGLSAAPIAQDVDGSLQKDYWYSSQLSLAKLDTPENIGAEAARRTLRRLGAKRVPTQQATVVFSPEVARSFLGDIMSAVNGDAIYRGASFLTGMLSEKIAGDNVTIVDDGTLPGRFGSAYFDGEGLPTQRTVVIERGVLKSYLLNTYTARKLGMASTGNASRGLAGAPGIGSHNFYLAPGELTPEQLIADVKSGLYLTGIMGFGVNLVTGDISHGATGLWIENGELTHAVEEITVAGNLKDMLHNISAMGNDLLFRSATSSPTLRVEGMTIAGG